MAYVEHILLGTPLDIYWLLLTELYKNSRANFSFVR